MQYDRIHLVFQPQNDRQIVADQARAWFKENWDPDLPLGQWWDRVASSGWAFPTWPTEWYGRNLTPDLVGAVNEARRLTGAVPGPAGIAQN